MESEGRVAVGHISNDPKELQKMLNITNEVANRYHIEFGSAKGKILKIGNKTTKPDIYQGEYKLEYTDNYKYLGEMLNHKGNAEDHTNVQYNWKEKQRQHTKQS